MNTFGLTPRPYKTKDGKVLYTFTLFFNGTDYDFKNFADEASALKYRLFLKRLKIKLGPDFDPTPYQAHHSNEEPLMEPAVTAIIESARIGDIPPASALLLLPAWATSVTSYQWKDGTLRYAFRLNIRNATGQGRGKPFNFRGFKSAEEAIAARLHLVTLREELGSAFDPKKYQRRRNPEAPLLLPLRPKGLGRLTKTFGQFAYSWMEEKRGQVSPTRWKFQRAHLQANVLEKWAYKELKAINEETFKTLIDNLLLTHTPSTVGGIAVTVASILVAAQVQGFVPNTFRPFSLVHGLR